VFRILPSLSLSPNGRCSPNFIYIFCLSKDHHHHHHHHHEHQGLDPLIRSVSRVTTVQTNVSSVFQLFFFRVVCSDMISKGFGLVAFFVSVKTSSVCIHLSCLVCIRSVVHGVRSRLLCCHKECSLLEVSITSFLSFLKIYLDIYFRGTKMDGSHHKNGKRKGPKNVLNGKFHNTSSLWKPRIRWEYKVGVDETGRE